jgi:hypothetical protein
LLLFNNWLDFNGCSLNRRLSLINNGLLSSWLLNRLFVFFIFRFGILVLLLILFRGHLCYSRFNLNLKICIFNNYISSDWNLKSFTQAINSSINNNKYINNLPI